MTPGEMEDQQTSTNRTRTFKNRLSSAFDTIHVWFTTVRQSVSWFTGWPGLARTGTLISSVTIVLNWCALVIAQPARAPEQSLGWGMTKLYEGSCSTTGSWFTGLHFLINILSTALLA